MFLHENKYKFSLTCSKMFFLFSVIFSCLFLCCENNYLVVFKMLQMKSLDLDMCIFVDWVSLLFSSILCVMVSCVLKFSTVYMEKDMFKVRFTYIVLSFVFSMLCLMYMPHFFFLLMGWDGLGITSFLLVIYYLSDSSWAAGMKTYLMNRMGDSFFIMGLVLFLFKGYWEMKSVEDKKLLGLMLVLGCFTKSAQFPFSSWLPAAMAAPTPVSSLVHSSTLVTAGVYLMMRFCHMFPDWLFMIIGLSGMWTLYSASLAACCEYDGKKVVAYSTLSQLGLMVVALSLKLPMFAFFHLMTHAIFKALMFICVGYFMVKKNHFQDLRSLKGVWLVSPILGITLMVSSVSLLGFPFLAGFYSKELIIENDMQIFSGMFSILLMLSLPLTAYYSSRLTFKMLKGANYKSFTCFLDKNMFLLSTLPLYFGSMFLGMSLFPWFNSLCSMYPSSLLKSMVLILLMMGVLLGWYDAKLNNKTLIFFLSTICFLTPFKSSFWKKYLGGKGSDYFYLLDQGIYKSSVSYLDSLMLKSGKMFQASFSYFILPKVKYFIMSMVGLTVFLGWMT